ncbi:hypothetical protein N7526_008490 [Penicillium atrosanguineum]|nr:hypothetical protein N7526_008490 [Penicillium atrosanguineum]
MSEHSFQSLGVCRKAAESLQIISKDIAKDLRPSGRFRRSYFSVKIVLQKGKVEKYKARLSNSIRLLSLSQQCYSMCAWLVFSIQPVIVPQIQVNDHTNDMHISPQKRIYLWRLGLPIWVTSKVLEIQGKRVYGGWQWVFRTYDIRPHGDPVFRFAKDGDLDGLRQIFSSGKVSPFVRDELGMTLLSWACYTNSFEVAEFLLKQGADPNALDNSNMKPISTIGRIRINPPRRSQPIFPLLRLLCQFEDESQEDPWDVFMRSYHRFRGTAEEFTFFQQACCPLFYTLSDEQRIRFAINEMGPCLSRNF